ncbi:hypothetical protein SG9_4140 [Salmonella enterica subsp. enterica serovar Gallinarum str. SG9]|nr:hypothetical protein SG9_4140 [Salmonella enterica subsp. enterica serovar Gallinarum str. SG9]
MRNQSIVTMVNCFGTKKMVVIAGKRNMLVNIPQVCGGQRGSMNNALSRHLQKVSAVKTGAPAKQPINLLLA